MCFGIKQTLYKLYPFLQKALHFAPQVYNGDLLATAFTNRASVTLLCSVSGGQIKSYFSIIQVPYVKENQLKLG